MKVRELIEKLQALDPEMDVWLDCGDPYDAGEITEVFIGERFLDYNSARKVSDPKVTIVVVA